jgi:Spy/CpxP family protein refolding chaperone
MNANGRFGWMTGLAVAVLMLGTLAVGVTYAQQGARANGGRWRQGLMMRQGPMGMMRMNLGQLGLTDQQRQQVKSILENHKADFQGLRDRAMPARQALGDAIAAGDEGAIRHRSTELSAVQTDTAVLASRVRAEISKILTPEQQQKAQALRQQVQQRTKERRGGRGPGRGLED